MDTNQIGKDAETQARVFLQSQGLEPISQNYHCLYGEIDLIMLHQGILVFVEVRKRTSSHFGGAALSVTPRKQEKIALSAHAFLTEFNQYATHACRFDLVAFDGRSPQATPQWYKDAFRLDTLSL